MKRCAALLIIALLAGESPVVRATPLPGPDPSTSRLDDERSAAQAKRARLRAAAAEIHEEWDGWNDFWWTSFWVGLGGCTGGAVAGALYLAWGGENFFNAAVSSGTCGGLVAVTGLAGGLISNAPLEVASRVEAQAAAIEDDDWTPTPTRSAPRSAAAPPPSPPRNPPAAEPVDEPERSGLAGAVSSADPSCIVGSWKARSGLDARGQYERLGVDDGGDFKTSRYWKSVSFDITPAQVTIDMEMSTPLRQTVPYSLETNSEGGLDMFLDYTPLSGERGSRRIVILSCSESELRLFDKMGALYVTWILDKSVEAETEPPEPSAHQE